MLIYNVICNTATLLERLSPNGTSAVEMWPVIIEIVSQHLGEEIDSERLVQYAKGTLTRWRGNAELLRKYYGRSRDGRGIGIYVWPTLESARRGHDEAWCDEIERRTGHRPIIEYFDLFMMLDNKTGIVEEYPLGNAPSPGADEVASGE